jgi:hypothetical protein
VIEVTRMQGWGLKRPCYAIASRARLMRNHEAYHELRILEGGYSSKRRGDTFFLGTVLRVVTGTHSVALC